MARSDDYLRWTVIVGRNLHDEWAGRMKRHEVSSVRIALAIYVICFVIGVMSHGRDFWMYGWRPYRSGITPLAAFWTALILLDASVVGLLLTGRRRSGLLAAVTIMALDVTANSYALFQMGFAHFAGPLMMQTAFFGFVVGSIAFVWPKSGTLPVGEGQEKSPVCRGASSTIRPLFRNAGTKL